eukprot:1157336-Pelagomonas_calceolata.AAC.4
MLCISWSDEVPQLARDHLASKRTCWGILLMAWEMLTMMAFPCDGIATLHAWLFCMASFEHATSGPTQGAKSPLCSRESAAEVTDMCATSSAHTPAGRRTGM